VFSRDLKVSLPVMSCYVYTRLLSYHTFNIAVLFGIFLAAEIVTNWSLWTNVFYDLFLMIYCLSSYDELLKKAKMASLYTGRLHKILMVVFKSLFVSTYPGYLKEQFVFRNSSFSLRGKNIVASPILRTTNYGLECIRYQAAKIWN